MGGRESHFEKATSPYSSWGSSTDDLACGPDRWTPIPSRSNSMIESSTRERPRPGSSDVYTIDGGGTESYFDSPGRVVTQQPLPLEANTMRAPIDALSLRSNRRKSYHSYPGTSFRNNDAANSDVPMDPVHYPTRTTTQPISAPVRRKKKKTRKKKSTTQQPIQIFIDVSGPGKDDIKVDTRSRNRTRITPDRYARSKTLVRRTRSEYSSGLRGDVRRNERTQSEIRGGPRHTHRSYELVTIPRRSPNPRNPPHFKPAPSSSKTTSTTSFSSRKVVAPRNKRGLEPPEPFRYKSVPDQPYRRIPTAIPIISKRNTKHTLPIH